MKFQKTLTLRGFCSGISFSTLSAWFTASHPHFLTVGSVCNRSYWLIAIGMIVWLSWVLYKPHACSLPQSKLFAWFHLQSRSVSLGRAFSARNMNYGWRIQFPSPRMNFCWAIEHFCREFLTVLSEIFGTWVFMFLQELLSSHCLLHLGAAAQKREGKKRDF